MKQMNKLFSSIDISGLNRIWKEIRTKIHIDYCFKHQEKFTFENICVSSLDVLIERKRTERNLYRGRFQKFYEDQPWLKQHEYDQYFRKQSN